MQSRSMARSQCWTAVSKGTGSLTAPDVNSTGNNQPWKKACKLWDSDPGSFSPFQCYAPINGNFHFPTLLLAREKVGIWLTTMSLISPLRVSLNVNSPTNPSITIGGLDTLHPGFDTNTLILSTQESKRTGQYKLHSTILCYRIDCIV